MKLTKKIIQLEDGEDGIQFEPEELKKLGWEEGDDLSSIEFLNYVCEMMLCAGYQPDSVKRAIYEKAEEYEYEDKGCD